MTEVKPAATTTDTKAAAVMVKEEQFRRFIEVEVLKIIKELSEQEETKAELLQEIAQFTLEKIQPGMTLEEMYKNAISLDDKYPQLGPIVIKIMQEYEQKYEQKAVDYVSQLIRDKQFDQANSVVQKILEYKMLQ